MLIGGTGPRSRLSPDAEGINAGPALPENPGLASPGGACLNSARETLAMSRTFVFSFGFIFPRPLAEGKG